MAVPVGSTGGHRSKARSERRLQAVADVAPRLEATEREALAEVVLAGPGSALTWADEARQAGLLQ